MNQPTDTLEKTHRRHSLRLRERGTLAGVAWLLVGGPKEVRKEKGGYCSQPGKGHPVSVKTNRQRERQQGGSTRGGEHTRSTHVGVGFPSDLRLLAAEQFLVVYRLNAGEIKKKISKTVRLTLSES